MLSNIIMLRIILIIILSVVLVGLIKSFMLEQEQEHFAQYLSIVDPYSIYLHKDASIREDLWHNDHTRKLYYYRDMMPQTYKE